MVNETNILSGESVGVCAPLVPPSSEVFQMVKEAKEDNPGPKIRHPKQISYKKFLSQRAQAFLDGIQTEQTVKMSDDKIYDKKSTGWTLRKELTTETV
jgi:hypothetical protein